MPDLTRLTRKPERGRADRGLLDELLDSQLVATVCTVTQAEPWVVPVFYARHGDQILLHGSTGAGALRAIAAGAPVAIAVHQVDALVLDTTLLHHSANYRSAVIRGHATALQGIQQRDALEILSEALIPGRTQEVPAITDRELVGTQVLAVPIEQDNWTYKERADGVAAPDPDHPQLWTGIVPTRGGYRAAIPSPWLDRQIPVPASVRALMDQ